MHVAWVCFVHCALYVVCGALCVVRVFVTVCVVICVCCVVYLRFTVCTCAYVCVRTCVCLLSVVCLLGHRSRLNFQFSNLSCQLSVLKSHLSTHLISQPSLLNFNFKFILPTFPLSVSFSNHLYYLRISSFDAPMYNYGVEMKIFLNLTD